MNKWIAAAAAMTLAASCSAKIRIEADGDTVIDQFIDAYNDHDAEAMAALAHDDIAWGFIAGDKLEIASRGKGALVMEMRTYFESNDSLKSKIEGVIENGVFTAAKERAYWEAGGDRKTQASIAVYELKDEKIYRVWYFPEQP